MICSLKAVKEFFRFIKFYAKNCNFETKNESQIKLTRGEAKGSRLYRVTLFNENRSFDLDIRELDDNKCLLEDAYTRDFTINSLYFRHCFHQNASFIFECSNVKIEKINFQNIQDLKNRILRPIPKQLAGHNIFTKDKGRIVRAIRLKIQKNLTFHSDLIELILDTSRNMDKSYSLRICRKELEKIINYPREPYFAQCFKFFKKFEIFPKWFLDLELEDIARIETRVDKINKKKLNPSI